jgi:transposase
MPFLRKRSALVLDGEEIEKLQIIKSSRTEAHTRVVRSRMLLAYAQGESVSSIARKESVSRPTVELCIDKALAGGIDAALRDLPRSGSPPKISAEDKAWVMHLACSKPTEHGYAAELWTLRQLADHARLHAVEAGHPSLQRAAKATVQRILKESSIHPHKMSYYLEKRDPEFDEKMAQVLMVYKEIEQFREEPSTHERRKTTISYDEKPGIQAIANIAADLPPEPGVHPTWSRDYEYKRLGTISLLAGIDLHDGHVMGIVRDRHRSREFIEFLAIADAHYPADWKLRIILDNHSTHLSKETMEWLKKRPNRFEFVYTPKHGSWLNMVEILFSKMARSFLRGIRVASKEELVERIYRYIDELNTSPVIFRWKYKLDEMSVA